MKGILPWQGLPGRSKNEKYAAIKKKKLETSLDELCKRLPHEIKEFMEYCRNLKFEQEPNYRLCIGMFESCMKRHSFDPVITDFAWKKNTLSKDKATLKAEMTALINRKPKIDAKQTTNIGNIDSNIGGINMNSGANNR